MTASVNVWAPPHKIIFVVVKVQNLQHSVLMVKNCKPVLLGEFLQPMLIQWILDLVVSIVDFAVFKAMCVNEGVCRWPFSLLSLQCDL